MNYLQKKLKTGCGWDKFHFIFVYVFCYNVLDSNILNVNWKQELRQNAISKNIDLPSAEQAIFEAITSLTVEAEATKGLLKSMEADGTQLKAKIERRGAELDRREKRLTSLQSVRPAYMDEFERHEVELKKLYHGYVDKMRNLAFLEQHVDEFSRVEQYNNEVRWFLRIRITW